MARPLRVTFKVLIIFIWRLATQNKTRIWSAGNMDWLQKKLLISVQTFIISTCLNSEAKLCPSVGPSLTLSILGSDDV